VVGLKSGLKSRLLSPLENPQSANCGNKGMTIGVLILLSVRSEPPTKAQSAELKI